MDVEGIGKTNEQIEERCVVNRFGNLGIGPSCLPQPLHLFIGDSVRVPGERPDELEQQPVFRRQAGGIEIAITNGGGSRRILLTLQLQEPRVAAQSIVAAVQG